MFLFKFQGCVNPTLSLWVVLRCVQACETRAKLELSRTERTSEGLALTNQFTHRHINFVGARKVNHMWSPVTLQEFVSRMHDKWVGTHCWLKFRQLTCDYQFYCYVMFGALFARCPFPLCEELILEKPTLFSPFCPLCILTGTFKGRCQNVKVYKI